MNRQEIEKLFDAYFCISNVVGDEVITSEDGILAFADEILDKTVGRQEVLQEKLKEIIFAEVQQGTMHVREILGALEYIKLELGIVIFQQTFLRNYSDEGNTGDGAAPAQGASGEGGSAGEDQHS